MKKKFLFDFFPELEDNKDLPLNLRNAQIPEGVHFKVSDNKVIKNNIFFTKYSSIYEVYYSQNCKPISKLFTSLEKINKDEL